MKKSFTLKAFAFGAAATVALAASATPNEFLVASQAQELPVFVKNNVKPKAPVTINKAVKETASFKAPAQKAEANYGDWSADGEGYYTFTQTLDSKQKYIFQRRDDSANPDNFQVKINGWGSNVFTQTGIDLTLSVEKTIFPVFNEDGTLHSNQETMAPKLPATGVYTGFKANGYPDGQAHEVYIFDRVDYFKALKAAGETWEGGAEITDDECNQWYALYGFDDVTGVLQYYPVYCLYVDNKPTWYTFPSKTESGDYLVESFQMLGNEYKNYTFETNAANQGYFNHEKDATTGTFTFDYEMNDNTAAYFRIISGKKTGSMLEKALKTMIEELDPNNMPADVIKVTESAGSVSVPVTTFRRGKYTLLALYENPTLEAQELIGTYSVNTLETTTDDIAYYAAGEATYTEAFMYQMLQFVFGEDFDNLGIPNTPTDYVVPMQQMSDGNYRLVHPYKDFYNTYLSNDLNYNGAFDYLKFCTADFNKSYIDASTIGIYYTIQGGAEKMLAVGSSNKFPEATEATANLWGTYANGALTFPAADIPENVESIDDITSALGFCFADKKLVNAKDVITLTSAVPSPAAEYTKIVAQCKEGEDAGVDAVVADGEFDANAPVEYFNLQGIRVDNPEAGQLLIKRQGNKAEKVVIR